jgi:hypothetical protein
MKANTPGKTSCSLALVLALGLAASALAEPIQLMSPLENLETVQGSAVVRKAGQALLVTLSSQDGYGRWFRIEASQGSSLPGSFRADSAEVLYWMGHLVLIAEGRAWHFAVPGLDKLISQEAQVPDGAQLAQLTRGHDLKEIKVSAIYSANGPRANRLNEGLRRIFANEDDNQDPGSGGLGTCGKSCTISCGDGSSCSASCGGVRCAHCTCPASCSCS